VTKYYLILKQ